MPEARWNSLRAIIARLSTAASRDDFVEECLATILETLGADRALAFLTDAAGATVTLEARGPGRRLTAAEQTEISRGVVHEVWRRGEPLRWELGDVETAGSMASLGILIALAAPLRPLLAGETSAQAPRGVLYVDFRDPRRDAGEAELELVELAAALIAVVLDRNASVVEAREELRAEVTRAGKRLPPPTLDELVRYPSMAPLRAELATAVVSELPLLMLGESGVGKTLLARAIAEASGRLPLVRAMLGAADDLNTITSELFGHDKGSFSGALAARTGLVGYADGGTLVLDEILNLPPHAQQLLLDFTQFGTYRPLGHAAAEPRHARTRIIAATNGDLDDAVRRGVFREDLFHRLRGLVVTLPPLRARRAEIPELAEGFLRRVDPDRAWRLTPAARRRLLGDDLPWPGNLRQLELVILRARDRALTTDRDAEQIDVAELESRELSGVRTSAPATADLAGRWRGLVEQRERLDEVERELLDEALTKHQGVITRAAQELGIGRTSFSSRAQTLKKP